MIDVMVDLETLSTDNDAAILSIGAVQFAQGAPNLGEFYTAVLPDLQVYKWKRHICPNTMKWWLDQSEAARYVFNDPLAVMLDKALAKFTEWIGGNHARIWGYGATFDNVILTSAYNAVGYMPPWNWRDNMCFRTLKALTADLTMVVPSPVVEHNALDDAKHQAAWAAVALKRLKENR